MQSWIYETFVDRRLMQDNATLAPAADVTRVRTELRRILLEQVILDYPRTPTNQYSLGVQ